MERSELLELWNDMWGEGNWVPSWPDSLAGLTAATAAWRPDDKCHSIWQEVVHVTYWRLVTIRRMAGDPAPSEEESERLQFAAPLDGTEEDWAAAVAALQSTQQEIARLISNEQVDVSRVPYHLIHDAYHLGRVTQLRGMLGDAPKF